MFSSARILERDDHQTDCAQFSQRLSMHGYAAIPASYYGNAATTASLLKAQASFADLEIDPSPGSRYRAFTRFHLAPGSRDWRKDENNDYFQSKLYNSADGGKIRRFKSIDASISESGVVKNLIDKDLEISLATGLLKSDARITIGLHQIRYLAHLGEVSYSSPLWLHRDDEKVVFVHLFNLSANAIGGDSLIAPHGRSISDVIRLKQPLDTLVVQQSVLHAVTPVGSEGDMVAFRDILLVTFHDGD